MDLASIIPKEHYNKQPKLPSVYSEEEIRKILISVDRSTAIGKRDYAILCLASVLGLRASDIANLKFENIHWEHNIIKLVQYKTGKGLVLPLLPEIGNSIIEYLRYGRKNLIHNMYSYSHIVHIKDKCISDNSNSKKVFRHSQD